ncbi:MAG: site-specific DNA-methyltransferase [Nitrososphaerota archaeon]|jgi:adenine-specific DNA-methyltransferase|nr:site-specific DNA-methyltransferase [Nitrososphaerota archaeon]MDG6950111.1 site-specific DNA-methyltransferase [Nitrososphaerota archaeon]
MSEKTAQAKPSVQADVRSENEAGAAQPEKFDLRSHTISEEKRRELLRLFPEVRTEGEKVDFNRLKLALGESVDTGKERYGLMWPGKADCFKAIQTPSLGTLLPVPEESVNWDTTENLIIEGDNLEVLKLLQKSYLGKVKMIYIDPPYNTGNDFIYPDDYAESLQTYLEYTGQVDSQGKRFSTNSDSEGRFHSKWLNMMYPRLYLARNLLTEDGVIFVSIDDGEVQNLRLILNDIFGDENFVCTFVWQKKHTRANDALFVSDNHEYILCFARRKTNGVISRLPRTKEADANYSNPDHDLRGPWTSEPLQVKTPNADYIYEIVTPSGRRVRPPEGRSWAFGRERYAELLADNRIYFGEDGSNVPRQKKFLSDVGPLVPTTLLLRDEVGDTQEGKTELKSLLEGTQWTFDNPKPSRLLFRLLQMGLSGGGIVLDFFAGSGSTGQAVLEFREQTSVGAQFILVQLPEPTQLPPLSPEGIRRRVSVADICSERVRRVVKRLSGTPRPEADTDRRVGSGRGFRIYKLSESNFKVWDSDRPLDVESLQRRLTDHVHHIREGRSNQDILTELLLKSGFPPTVRTSEVSVGGKKAFKVTDGRLVVCLDRQLTLEAIRAIADLRPERVVCLDEGFEGNDQLKVNAAQTFKTKGIVFQIV